MKYILVSLALSGIAFAGPTSPLAPLSKRGEVIDDSYIVVFKKDVNPQQMALHLAGLEEWHSADVSFSFSHFLFIACMLVFRLAAMIRGGRGGLPRGVTPLKDVDHITRLPSALVL